MSDRQVSSSSSAGGGIGVFGLTFVVLLALELTGHINIGMLWVFAPLWIPTAVVLGLIVLGLVIWGLVTLATHLLDKRKIAKVRKHKEKMRQDRTYRP